MRSVQQLNAALLHTTWKGQWKIIVTKSGEYAKGMTYCTTQRGELCIG